MRRAYNNDQEFDAPGMVDYSNYIHVSLSRRKAIVAAILVGLFLLFVVAILITMTVYIVKYHDVTEAGVHAPPKNLILMISDGCGPASMTMAREIAGKNLPIDALLSGTVKTISANSLITDSAAGATAYACGRKTNNERVATDSDGKAMGTILEAAQRKGMRTGLVATSRITHATPASFASHVIHRDLEDYIAQQELAHKVNVMLGGGLNKFSPNSRPDHLDLLKAAQEEGYTLLYTVDDLLSYHGDGPVLGLFAQSHLSYEIDRNATREPSLRQMAEVAIATLNKENKHGFFLMIEGSRIDMAAHDNDPAAHYHEILAYNDALEAVLEFAKNDQSTLVVSVSDHETGGLSLGNNPRDGGYPKYQWYPSVVSAVTASSERMYQMIAKDNMSPTTVLEEYAKVQPDAYDLALLANNTAITTIGDIISYYAGIGWSTFGHSSVDINLYSSTHDAKLRERFIGNFDNTDIGKLLMDIFKWDVDVITKELANFNTTGTAGARRYWDSEDSVHNYRHD